MDWKQLIADVRAHGLTLEDIRTSCGFASRGHVHGVTTGKQQTVVWEVGDNLIRLHRRITRQSSKRTGRA